MSKPLHPNRREHLHRVINAQDHVLMFGTRHASADTANAQVYLSARRRLAVIRREAAVDEIARLDMKEYDR